jgi:hypothetical protein
MHCAFDDRQHLDFRTPSDVRGRTVNGGRHLEAIERIVGDPPVTPDGRYIVIRGRLWRRANPELSESDRQTQVDRLMGARRAIWQARKVCDEAAIKAARAQVDAAKTALGERGPVWWTDGTEDVNRHMARNTIYADWYAAIDDSA